MNQDVHGNISENTAGTWCLGGQSVNGHVIPVIALSEESQCLNKTSNG